MSWEKVRLEELCDINMGKTPSRNNSSYWNGELPWVSIADLKGDTYITNTKECITKKSVVESGIKIVPKNTLLYSFKLSIGKVAITGCDIFTNEAIVALPIKDNEILDLKYLYWAVQVIELEGIGDKAVMGLTLNKEKIRNLKISFPPLTIQKRIAEILDTADALRRKDQALLNKYDELAQSIFIDMFGDPVKNDKDWNKIPFAELFDSRLGKMLDSKKQNGGLKYQYLGNSNVQWFRFNLENLLEMEFDESEIKKFQLKKGDILICEGGEVGRSAIWNDEKSNVYFQKAVHRARILSNNITPEYTVMLFWFLKKLGGLNDYVTSATIAHLTGEKLKTIPIPVPPIDLQNNYKAAVIELNKQKVLLEKSINYTENIFQSLIQKAFNGEFDL